MGIRWEFCEELPDSSSPVRARCPLACHVAAHLQRYAGMAVRQRAASRLSSLANCRTACLCPPRQAFREDFALPSVREPVECSHGRQPLIAIAC